MKIKAMIQWFLVGLIFALQVYGQDYEKIAPKTPPPSNKGAVELPEKKPVLVEGKEEVLVENLKGLVFISSAKEIHKEGWSGLTGVHATGLKFLDVPDFEKRMEIYLGKPVSLKSLNELTRDIVIYYREKGRPVVDIAVPEQDIASGIVQVVVTEGKVGEVRTEGNKWFDSKFLVNQVQLKSGDVIQSKELTEDINWLNSNPFRQVDLVFTPGKKQGETDLVLKTKDRFPIRVYSGYEDTGNNLTGDERILFGLNWGYAFKQDHQFNYQYTGDGNFNKLAAHSGSYVIALPWRHRLAVFGSYAETKADIANPLLNLTGRSWQLSTRYTASLPTIKDYMQEITGGFDYKNSNNNLEFGGASVFNTTTEVLQWNLGYSSGLKDPWGNTALGMNLFYSPGDLTGDNKDKNFQASRAFSRADYFYSRFNLERVTKLPYDFSWVAKGTYQFSEANLLGSEQLGIGGYNTVRGYDEREGNGDEGYLLSTELRTPPISFGKELGITQLNDQFQFLGFFDYGTAKNKRLLPGEDPNVLLAGAGPGFRYTISPYLSARADYGFQLYDTGNNSRYNSRWHIGLVISY